MHDNHRRTIARLVDKFEGDSRFHALILGGSVAKGRALPTADVDIMLVATDEEYARRRATRDVLYFDREPCDYPGGYVDGKIVDMGFLRDAAERGSEPTRFSFLGAQLIYSHIPEIAEVLQRIPVYQEHEQQTKIAAFYTRMVVSHWYVREAWEKDHPYLLSHGKVNLVLFGGRLVLAHNRILFPYHKWLMYELERAPEKPEGFVKLAHMLLKAPSSESADAFYESVVGFREWGLTENEGFQRWTDEFEFGWRSGRPSVEDW